MSELSILLLVMLPFLALLVWAIIEITTRSDLGTLHRIGWFLAIAILPVIGLAAYVVVRPPKGVRRSGGHPDTAKAEAIVLIAERRQRGEISDEEFRVNVGAIASID